MTENNSRSTSERKTGNRRQMAWRVLSVVVTVTLLYFVLDELQGADLGELITRIPAWSWIGALLVYLALNLLRALRFHVLLDKRDSPMRLLIPITLYHNGLVRVVPFKLGEISYVILLKTRLNYTMQEGVGSLFGARILELVIIVLVFAFGIFMSGEQFAAQRDQLTAGVLSVFLVSVIGLYYAGSLLRLALNVMQRIPILSTDKPDSFFAVAQSKLIELAAEFDRIRQPRLFFSALFISCFTYTSSFLTNYILLRAVGLDADLPIVITVISLGMFGSAFPFTLSGFGIVETAWWTGLTRFAGYAGDEAAAIGIVLHGFQIVAAVLYGLVGYVLIRLSPPMPANSE